MKKSWASLVDELIVTNIKIYFLDDQIGANKASDADSNKLQDLEKYRARLHSGLDKLSPIHKTLAHLIDELTVTNIKIFVLVDKILKDEHSKEDAKKAQDLNRYRSELSNAISKEFKQTEVIKV